MKKTDFVKVLSTLQSHEVEFIVVGGVSAVLQGVPVTTFDLDILHHRTPDNVEKLWQALQELNAHYRTKKDVRMEPTREGLLGPGHHLLLTDAGPLDVLGVVGTIKNFKSYPELLEQTTTIGIQGMMVHVQGIESLIEIKRMVGRDKDLAMIPILEHTLQENKQEKK